MMILTFLEAIFTVAPYQSIYYSVNERRVVCVHRFAFARKRTKRWISLTAQDSRVVHLAQTDRAQFFVVL